MQAKLTITTEGSEQGIFIYTDCDYTYVNDTAQIIYRDIEHGISVTIGLNRDKVSLLRIKEVLTTGGAISPEKQFNVLTVVRPDYKEMIDTESMEILCLADGIGLDYGERFADLAIRCFIGVYGGKPMPDILRVSCRVIEA